MATAASAPSGFRSLIGPVVAPRAFDFTQPLTAIRVAAGLFYIPHILFKLTGIAGSLAFFAKADPAYAEGVEKAFANHELR